MKKHFVLAILIPLCALLIININDLYIYNIYGRSAKKGIDISHHQGDIDWQKVSHNYSFVFIKATEGDDFTDHKFIENIENARKAGFIVGAYHFFNFNYSGYKQAWNFISIVGNRIDIAPVIDVEFGGNTDEYNITSIKKELNDMIVELEKYYGIKPILYLTKESINKLNLINTNEYTWIRSVVFPLIKSKGNIIWQYSNRGSVSGINGRVDLNLFIGSEKEFSNIIIMH